MVADLVRAVAFPVPGTVSDRFVSALVAAAFACAAGLLMRRDAMLAWSAATAAVGLAALDFVGFAQAARVANDVGAWQVRLVVANVCLVAAAVIAVVTARTALPMLGTNEQRALRIAMPIGLVVVVFYAITGPGHSMVLDADGLPDASWLRWGGRVTLIVVAIALLAGAVAALRGPFARARAAASSPAALAGSGDRLGRFVRALGDEVSPAGRADGSPTRSGPGSRPISMPACSPTCAVPSPRPAMGRCPCRSPIASGPRSPRSRP